jgi:hypothetical protein
LGLIDYLPTDFVADVIYFSLLSITYFFDGAEDVALPQTVSKPGIMSPNPSNLLAQKLGWHTVTARDSSQIPSPNEFSKCGMLAEKHTQVFGTKSALKWGCFPGSQHYPIESVLRKHLIPHPKVKEDCTQRALTTKHGQS